jgi:hypothetical protein
VQLGFMMVTTLSVTVIRRPNEHIQIRGTKKEAKQLSL